MVRKYGCFEEKGRSESLKVCGNCARVRFSLTKEETDLLTKTLEFSKLENIRHWLKLGIVMRPGGSRNPDAERTHVVSLIDSHRVICLTAKARVQWIDTACFLWLPASENQL